MCLFSESLSQSRPWKAPVTFVRKFDKFSRNVIFVPQSFCSFYNIIITLHTNLQESTTMVSEMVQNSQSLYSFTFNAVIVIHEYIYSHSTTEFTFKKYLYSHLPVYFLFTIIFARIYEMSSFTFNVPYSFTFTVEIFIQHFLRTTFAHH